MKRYSFLIIILYIGLFLSSCSRKKENLELVEVKGTLLQLDPITLCFQTPIATFKEIPPEDFQLMVSFSHIHENYVSPGYISGRVTPIDSIFITWQVRFTPDDFGIWNYNASLIKSIDYSADESTNTPFNKISGALKILPQVQDKKPLRQSGFIKYNPNGYFTITDNMDKFYINSISFRGNYDDLIDFLLSSYEGQDHEQAIDNIGTYSSDTFTIPLKAKHKQNPLFLNGMMLSASDLYQSGIPSLKGKIHYANLLGRQKVLDSLETCGYSIIIKIYKDGDSEVGKLGGIDNYTRYYLRDIVARFSHMTGLIWAIEINDNRETNVQYIKDIAKFIKDIDPYEHPILLISNLQNRPLEAFAGYPYIEGIILKGVEKVSMKEWFSLKGLSEKMGRKLILIGNEVLSTSKISDIPEGEGARKLDEITWIRMLTGGSGMIWEMGDKDIFHGDRMINLFNQKVISAEKINSLSIPYTAKLLYDSLYDSGILGIKPLNSTRIYYITGESVCTLDSLFEGKYRINWYHLNGDSTYHQSDTVLRSPVSKMILTSPSLQNVNNNWLLIVDKQD